MFFVSSKKYKKALDEKETLLLETTKLHLQLLKFSKAERLLSEIVENDIDISELDTETEEQRKTISLKAREILSNKVFKYIIDSKRRDLIMSAVKESRDYPELVQKRSNLLFIEESIIGELRRFANLYIENNEGQEDDL